MMQNITELQELPKKETPRRNAGRKPKPTAYETVLLLNRDLL